MNDLQESIQRLRQQKQTEEILPAVPAGSPDISKALPQLDSYDTPIDERHVNMSNALTRSAHKMGLAQKRIIALALAKNDSRQAAHLIEGQRHGWLIRLTAKDYATTYEVDIEEAYDQLKKSVYDLIQTTWEIVEQKGKRKTVTVGSWLFWAKYHEGQGCIDIAFHPIIAPHLLGLRQQFVTYQLKKIAALRSIYSWRLYECLQSWKEKGRWLVTAEDFKKIMQIPDSYKQDFGQVQRSIINPAIAELIEKQSMLITYTTTKTGRVITDLEFQFEDNPQQTLELK